MSNPLPTPRTACFSRLASLTLLALLAAAGGCRSGARGGGAASRPSDVSGRYVLSVCDADMPATAFFDNQLGPRDPSATDALTVIKLPLQEPQTLWAQAAVSNSVIGPPNTLAVSTDGNTAVVVESRGPAPAGATTTEDLPTGERLTGIDLTDPLHPNIFAVAVIGDNPTGVAIHPDGDLVAAVCMSPREQINLVPITRAGKKAPATGFGEALAWPLVGLDDDESVPSSIDWHPSGGFLAVTLPSRNQVAFYRFTRDQADGSFGLQPWGEPVNVGKYPYLGRFLAGGDYFITTDLQWGNDVAGFFVESPPGQLSVIRFDAEGSPGGEPPLHAVVSQVPVGINPEGLAISSDSTLVVTSNLQRSFLPEDNPRLTRGGSLSLLKFNPRSGQLTSSGEYPVNAMPAGISFDARNRYVVVTQFRSFDPEATDGELAFWRVVRGKTPSLQRADFVVGVGKGPHGVLIVR
jgi:hypothetical protein